MNQIDTYVVTERAGPKVAGLRVTAGDEIPLTEAQAEHELREGTIIRKGATLDPAFTTDNDALAALRQAARGEDAPARKAARSEPPQPSAVPPPDAQAASDVAPKGVKKASKGE